MAVTTVILNNFFNLGSHALSMDYVFVLYVRPFSIHIGSFHVAAFGTRRTHGTIYIHFTYADDDFRAIQI